MDAAELIPPPRTTVPVRPSAEAGTQARRRVGRLARNDILDLAGAFAVAICVSMLLFGRIAPLSGLIGFIMVSWLLFVLTYAALVRREIDGAAARDKVMTSILCSAAIVMMLPLAGVITYTVYGGRKALLQLNFYSKTLPGPLAPLTQGGVLHAIVGTLWMIGIAVLITVPLGLTCAIYLSEVGGRLARVVRAVVEAMTALPSIIAGLLVFAALVITFKQHSGLFAALALSVMMLPIIIRSADVVLRLVPSNLREASEALGSSSWRTVRHVVLPTARSGLVTAVILGMARGIGETSPVLLTAGYTTFLNKNPLHGSMVSLPLVTFELIRSGQTNYIVRGLAAGALLLLIVLALFTVARLIGGQDSGHISKRRARRIRRASARDVARILSSSGRTPPASVGGRP